MCSAFVAYDYIALCVVCQVFFKNIFYSQQKSSVHADLRKIKKQPFAGCGDNIL